MSGGRPVVYGPPRRSGWSSRVAAALLLTLGAVSWPPVPLSAQATALGAAGHSAERLSRVSQALDEYVERGDLPGGVILVARGGRVLLHDAFGYRDLEARTPQEPDDLFRIASQTKAIVSVAIMALQEEGRLLLTDPVHRFLPEYEHTTVAVPDEQGGFTVEPARRAITIRDLLTHTAGVGYGGGVAGTDWEAAGVQGWYFADREEPIRATVERMAALPFEAHPGERFVYGYSTDILGAVIEVVAGEPLDTYLDRTILGPLGMSSTFFYVPGGETDRLSTVYSRTEEGLERAPDPGGMVGQGAYVDGPRTSFSGGAGLISTAGDYHRFLQMLLNGGSLDGIRILSRKSVQLMTADHAGDLYQAPGAGFGLGFSVIDDLGEFGSLGSEGAFGWGGAYHSTYWVDPQEDLLVVYFTQVIPATGLDDFARVRALVYQALTGS